MEQFFLMLAVAVVALGVMMLGLAITRLRKGRDLQSDVGTNDNMKQLGLVCTAKTIMQEEKRLKGVKEDSSCDSSCSGCGVSHC